MEPWYNMNRIEQIIGRARRNCSHKELDKEKRNVQVYLHGTIIYDTNIETLDMYMYRQAEIKAISIGKITRLLKQNAIDCLLNENQKDFSKLDKTEYLTLSNQNKISLSLFGKNLLDEVARNHSSFVKNEVPLPGRNFGLKINYKF